MIRITEISENRSVTSQIIVDQTITCFAPNVLFFDCIEGGRDHVCVPEGGKLIIEAAN